MQLKNLTFEQGIIKSPLPASRRDQLMEELGQAWQIETGELDRLARTYQFANFVAAMDFANKVCDLAERFDHHPELLIEYGRATVRWWTHTARGIAANDLMLARETEALYGSQEKN